MNQLTQSRMPSRQHLPIPRQKMPEQDAAARADNFNEVNLGLTEEAARLEAGRCLQCKKPRCVGGCPVAVNIPKFLGLVAENRLAEAAHVLRCDNALPAVTGRVCPQEKQCEAHCVLGRKGSAVGIGYLERFVADWADQHCPPPAAAISAQGKKVAIVGSGPAGLTAAGELARRGYAVTIYEALHKAGGVLSYGIPEFRLPKKIVAREIERLQAAGVTFRCNVVIGRTYTIQELQAQFDAIFIANGAGLPAFMNIPGESLKGVYAANEYLTRINLMNAHRFPDSRTPVLNGRRVAVIGAGNVAMDAVRSARRLGAAEAMIVYRRSRNEMPARIEEINHAEAEGITLQLLTAPLEIIGDDRRWVTGLKCQRMQMGAPDASGRARPEPVPGSEFILPCDVVVMAIGTRANPLLTATCPELKLNAHGNIIVDENGMTSLAGVFAGGDIVRGAATVILAMGDGKRAAKSIDQHLRAQPPAAN
ncbi:MAG: NADPH-dependent glutamate synthase [Verrucomicrobiae bacterium]|nr:NADPH-dependent glutamate synthase [Verrucomicrobiae bacterium]